MYVKKSIAMLVGAEVKKKSEYVDRSLFTRPLWSTPHLLFNCSRLATLSTTSIQQPTRTNDQQSSCIVGNVGTQLWFHLKPRTFSI